MIFIDTGAFLGRYLAADQHHDASVIGWERIRTERSPYCTSNLVLNETFTLLARMADGAFAARTGQLIYTASAIQILRAEKHDEQTALDLLDKYADQHVSFCDCVSFSLMKRYRIQNVFGFDHHFERAGFHLWPQP